MHSIGKLQALIVGLGNPGAKYERTRHNIGFRFLDHLYGDVVGRKEVQGGKHQIVQVRTLGAGWVERFDGLFAEAEVVVGAVLPADGRGGSPSPGSGLPRGQPVSDYRIRVGLLKPLTFMNRSGASVGAAAKKFSLRSWQTVVCHDELDIPFGDVRSKRSGGEAGHNGLKSISQVLGSRDYYRIRLGIGRPVLSVGSPSGEGAKGAGDRGVEDNGVVDWVLGRFAVGEESRLSEQFDSAGGHLASALMLIAGALEDS